MQYLPLLLAFVAGSLTTILLDVAVERLKTRRAWRVLQDQKAMERSLEARGWRRPEVPTGPWLP